MKKFISVLLAIMLLAGLCACGSTPVADNEKLTVVTTIFPIYDWTINILGKKAADAEVTMLLDNGVDLHSYQPTADDIIKISTCDVFIYVGGESDEWVYDALREAINKDMTVINLIDVLGDAVREEETVEGMETEEDEAGEEPEYDEHIWLSLRNAEMCCNAIAAALAEKDSENAELYKLNAESYTEKLAALDEEYQSVADNASVKTLLFGDRFPFRYLTDDYGIEYYAAFSGCSAESEASFETVTFLADKLVQLKLPCVITLEASDNNIAETVISVAGIDAEIVSVDSMQSTTSQDMENGASYIAIMESNLTALRRAMN